MKKIALFQFLQYAHALGVFNKAFKLQIRCHLGDIISFVSVLNTTKSGYTHQSILWRSLAHISVPLYAVTCITMTLIR